MKRWLMLLAMLLAACATPPPAPMVPVAQLGVLAQSELVTLVAGDREFAFTARLESDGDTLRVVAITPTGQRLFAMRRHGAQLDAEAGPLWPAAMPLEAVWADIEMVHVEMLARPEAVTARPGWKRMALPDGQSAWFYRGREEAKLVRETGRIVLIRPAYRLSVEVLPE
ncbi:DUF3261 domain-containing protein [Chitinilyticum litopenaei]|uniref:DUF3261 domain-containing protein n=1 Tax=Chitinilyticum litopenaei TaxID=1121276 RepID=UPI00048BF132|nr:DUF3261 domain-containing protein [Chitinilyticum litopenaei]